MIKNGWRIDGRVFVDSTGKIISGLVPSRMTNEIKEKILRRMSDDPDTEKKECDDNGEI